MSTRATGTFEVKLNPQPLHNPNAGLARMSIAKQFHGDLEADSAGEMLSARGAVQSSAG